MKLIPYRGYSDPIPSHKTKEDDVKENGRLCITTADPHCRAVGQLMSDLAGKEFIPTSSLREWEAVVRSRSLHPATKSITFIFPLWDERQQALNIKWYVRTLSLMRELLPKSDGATWGLLTGPDVTSLSLLAVKSLLQREIQEHYTRFPTSIFTTHEESSTRGSILPRWDTDDNSDTSPLRIIDTQHVTQGRSHLLAEHSWAAMIFQGHGRSYCACGGHLCGARRIDHQPDRKLDTCVFGLMCADSTFPQIDPRRYDTPVIVLDTCGAGNWAFPVWETGIPSLAFHAAAGASGSVIASDGITQNIHGDFVDILCALTTSATMGEATKFLNLARQDGNINLPYFLIGDPDIACGETRWPSWATEAQPGSSAVTNGRWTVSNRTSSSPFIKLSLGEDGMVDERETLFISTRPEVELSSCQAFRLGDQTEVWLGVADDKPLTFVTERRPSAALPTGLITEALSIPMRVRDWKAPLDRGVPRLIAAARRVEHTSQFLQGLRGSVVAISPEAVDVVVSMCIAEWMGAQAECVQLILERTEEGLWPFYLWPTRKFQAQVLAEPCPICGASPTIRRSYESSNATMRHWWECMRCDLISDEPALPTRPELSLQVTDSIETGQSLPIELEIDNRRGKVDWLGAGSLMVDRSGHGVKSTPEIFPVRVNSGEQSKVAIKLSLERPPPIPHLYRVRGVLVLNGHWFWISRPLFVNDGAFKSLCS